MRPRSHQRGELHRSRRAALPKYFPLSHSMMTLLNGLISLNLIQSKLNFVDHHHVVTCRDKPALTHEPQRGALSHPRDVKLLYDCDLIPQLITILLTFLYTLRGLDSAPMPRCLRRRLMTGLTLHLGIGDLDLTLLPLDTEGFLQISRSMTPLFPHSFKSELRAALPTGKRIVAEIMTLVIVQLRLLPQVAAILLHLSFNDCFSRSTTRSRGARPKSRDAELRSVHVGMISTLASVRSRRSITVLTLSRRRLNRLSLPLLELSLNTRLSSVISTSGSPEARRR